jgi:predicted GNAT family acetyltransferase
VSRVRADDSASRYVLEIDGGTAGRLEYTDDGDVVDLVHTEVDTSRRERGLGSELVAGALDDLRGKGRRVRATCPFVARFVDEHPDYADLVA